LTAYCIHKLHQISLVSFTLHYLTSHNHHLSDLDQKSVGEVKYRYWFWPYLRAKLDFSHDFWLDFRLDFHLRSSIFFTQPSNNCTI